MITNLTYLAVIISFLFFIPELTSSLDYLPFVASVFIKFHREFSSSLPSGLL